MQACLGYLVAVTLLICGSAAAAIDAYSISVFGIKANMPKERIEATLKNAGFTVQSSAPDKAIAGATRVKYKKAGHFVELLVHQGIPLTMSGSEFSIGGKTIRLGQSQKSVVALLGKADIEQVHRENSALQYLELRYNDEKHLVPFCLQFKGGTLYKFILAPGPEAYEKGQ